MKLVILAVCFLPTIIESYLDRYGESKKGKIKDGVWLSLVALAVVGASWRWLGYNPLAVLLLLLAIRFSIFDYLTHFFLKRYSPGHKNINIWKFTGTTAYFDRLTAKVDWRLRIVIRLSVFALAVWWYLK